MHDRLIGALETCSRQGEMLRIWNRHVDWERFQIAIPGANAKDSENRRVPFDPQGRLAPILKRRKSLGPAAFVFGGPESEFQDSFKTAWESRLLRANGHDITRAKKGARVGREKLREIDLHWHDLRHGLGRAMTDVWERRRNCGSRSARVVPSLPKTTRLRARRPCGEHHGRPIEPRRIVSQLSVATDLALPEGRLKKSGKRMSWLANLSTDKSLWEVCAS